MRRWLRDTAGASAVEFALLAPVALLLIFGTLDVAWMYAQDASQDAAAMRLARDLKVGFVNDVRLNEATARARMCEGALLLSCDDLDVTTQAKTSLSSTDLQPPSLADDGRLEQTGFTAGNADEFLIVTVHRAHRFLTPLIGGLLQNGRLSTPFTLPRTSRIIIRSEPW